MRAPLFGLLFVVLSQLVPAIADAHPYGTKFHSMRHEIRVSADGLEAVVILEVPTPVVLRQYQKRYGEAEVTPEDADKDFLAWQCGRLGEGLALAVNGEPAVGQWVPADHPSNGRGGERFFVYLMSFSFDHPPALGDRIDVTLPNASLPKAKTYYSGFADAGAPWLVAENSARDLIGDRADAKEVDDDPDAWTRDEAARTLKVVFTRGG